MKPRNQQPKPPSQQPNPADPGDSGSKLDEEFLARTSFVPDAIQDNPDDDDAAAETAGTTSEAEAISPELIASALGPTFRAAFHAVASKRGAHWELIDFEESALVKGWTPILQYMLAKLGNQEQVLLGLAVMSTSAIVGGKMAQDIKRGSSVASTRTPESAASSASSGSATLAKRPAPNSSWEEPTEL